MPTKVGATMLVAPVMPTEVGATTLVAPIMPTEVGATTLVARILYRCGWLGCRPEFDMEGNRSA